MEQSNVNKPWSVKDDLYWSSRGTKIIQEEDEKKEEKKKEKTHIVLPTTSSITDAINHSKKKRG